MTNAEIYENSLRHFNVVRRYGDSAQCVCPAHDDKEASLRVTMGNKCTVFKCYADCVFERIIAAGLEEKDTFYNSDTLQPKWQAYVENREKKRIEEVYNYVSINGNYAFTKIRLEGKKMLYGRLEGECFLYGLNGRRNKNCPD